MPASEKAVRRGKRNSRSRYVVPHCFPSSDASASPATGDGSLENAVAAASGYDVQVEEAQLNLRVDAASLADRTKSEMDLEAASGLDFDLRGAD